MIKFPRYDKDGKIQETTPSYPDVFQAIFLVKAMKRAKKIKGFDAFKLGALSVEAGRQYINAAEIFNHDNGVNVKNIEKIKEEFNNFNKFLESVKMKPYTFEKMVKEVDEFLLKVYPYEIETNITE